MKLITLYARREPTTDSVLLKYAPQVRKLDVVIYNDENGTTPKARFSWWHSGKPHKGSKVITLNCWRWALKWLPEK